VILSERFYLLREARACGCRTMSGGGMAAFQVVETFRLFTDIEPGAARMLRHFAEIVGEFRNMGNAEFTD
jgi:shikimate dehydrogenase